MTDSTGAFQQVPSVRVSARLKPLPMPVAAVFMSAAARLSPLLKPDVSRPRRAMMDSPNISVIRAERLKQRNAEKVEACRSRPCTGEHLAIRRLAIMICHLQSQPPSHDGAISKLSAA